MRRRTTKHRPSPPRLNNLFVGTCLPQNPGHRQRPARHGAVIAAAIGLLLVLILTPAVSVYGKASHDGWPVNKCISRWDEGIPGCGVYRSHNEDQNGVLRGTGRSDELLGGHGDDLIYGRDAGDVIWGDFWP